MNKETIRNFLAWLDQATDEEIQARKKAAIEALGKVSTREGKSDICLVLRLIDEELIARMEVGFQKSN